MSLLQVGDTFLLKRTPQQDDFYHLMNGKFCGEAWDAVSRYVYTALQDGYIMHGWTNDECMLITCGNDGTRPVIFKILFTAFGMVDTVTNAITKGVIKKYNKPSDKNIQLNELGIKLSKLAKKEG